MKQLVLAGNQREFENYCRRNNLSSEDAVFLETADQLRGTTADSFEFVKLKNWHLNPITNAKEFWDFLSAKRPRFRDAD
jgi:hypothetical protein